MTSFQWIIYIIGIISFIIGCFFYYISKNENHNNNTLAYKTEYGYKPPPLIDLIGMLFHK